MRTVETDTATAMPRSLDDIPGWFYWMDRLMFDRLLALRNDLGLLAEEYEPSLKRLVGNFPQAFSHIGLVNTALRLDAALRDSGA